MGTAFIFESLCFFGAFRRFQTGLTLISQQGGNKAIFRGFEGFTGGTAPSPATLRHPGEGRGLPPLMAEDPGRSLSSAQAGAGMTKNGEADHKKTPPDGGVFAIF
jgi:hypothetical protein